MSKLKVAELFSGIGSQVAALKRLGVNYECVGISEIDKYAIKSYEAINGPTRNYGDISKIDRLDYTDLLIYSSPCFPRGSMVLTDSGYKDIADIQVGDKVLTHLGNWKPVVRVMNNGIKDLVKLTFNDGAVIRCTPNHKFLCTNEAFDCENVGEWVEAKDIGENYPIWIKNGEKGHGWVTSYEKDEEEEVFDIEVEDDHSFTVSNYVVHNCTDFSLAGKQSGLFDKDGKQTRSGLLLEVGRLLMKMSDEKILPKYLLMENVKNLVGKKFKPAFDIWLQALEAIGYNNYWKVLNAKDYGVPQNRERVFVVSIRKDVDTNGYTFPEPFKLERRLKDVLEPNVDEKFYLSQKLVEGFIRKLERRQDTLGKINIQDVNKTCSTITARIHKCFATDPYICQSQNDANGTNGSSDTLGINEPLIAASRGRNPDNPLSREAGLPTEQQLEINRTGCSNTLTTVGKDNLVVEPKIDVLGNYKPSGHECGRVMSVDGVAPTIKDNHGAVYSIAEPQIKQIGNLYSSKTCDNPNQGRVYDETGLLPALTCMSGGNREQCVVEPINTCADGTAPALTIHLHKETVNDCTKLDRHSPALGLLEIGIGHNSISKKFEFDGFHEDKPSPTLLATDYKAPKCWCDGVRIRKLTPKECWRLMDFTDEEFEAAESAGVSKTQLYKQAGNSIVVSCLAHIFRELLKDTEYEPEEGFKTDWLKRLKGTDNA